MADLKKPEKPEKPDRPGPVVPEAAFEKLARHFRQDAPPTAADLAAAKEALACCQEKAGGRTPQGTLSRAGLAAELGRRAADGCGHCDWPEIYAALASYFPAC